VLVAGAPGVERAYVFERANAGAAWSLAKALVSSEHAVTQRGSAAFTTQASFGASVALQAPDTIVVGAPTANALGGSGVIGATNEQLDTRAAQGAVFVFVRRSDTGVWTEHAVLRAADAEPGIRFGHAVAFADDQLLVGAPGSRARPRTTWDFETGTLAGWTATGTAFNTQPTYGDNTAARPVYSRTVPAGAAAPQDDPLMSTLFTDIPGASEYAGLRGTYWIGTYENRPTAGDAPGGVQGDSPMGTLESDPFRVDGDWIAFLVGGGCRITDTYVELLVDGGLVNGFDAIETALPNVGQTVGGNSRSRTGARVKRTTGRCEETMRRVVWDVRLYRGLNARIRIVDGSSADWGHIAVDDIRFGWAQGGALAGAGGSCDLGQCGSDAGPAAGAVYAFRRRHATASVVKAFRTIYEPCQQSCGPLGCVVSLVGLGRWTCVWEEQQKLVAADRRARDAFGTTLAWDAATGVALVGAPGGRAADMFNRDASLQFFAARDRSAGDDEGDFAAGATYVFQRTAEARDGVGLLLSAPLWALTEDFRVQAPDKAERALYGLSVALSGVNALVAAPQSSAMAVLGGAVYMLGLGVVQAYFAQDQFVTVEPSGGVAGNSFFDVEVRRTGSLAAALSVEYATSDVSAVGVSNARWLACLAMVGGLRGAAGCGDYVQTSGQ
jgi:hypothetical protein